MPEITTCEPEVLQRVANRLKAARPDVYANIDRAFPTNYTVEKRSNCWGFTAVAIGAEYELYWMREHVIVQHLRERTEMVNTPQIGDVVAYWRGQPYDPRNLASQDYILHTAIYAGDELVLHKRGYMPVEYSHMFISAIYGHHVTFHRVKGAYNVQEP